MSVSPSLLRHQGPQLASLVRAGVGALAPSARGGDIAAVSTPGPAFTRTVTPPAELVSAYLRFVGGDPASWKGRVPPHLFCWWAFPLLGRTIEDLPLDPTRVVNGGATITVNRPLPAGTPLVVGARLDRVDHDPRRTLVVQRITTGPASDPEAVVYETRLFFRGKAKEDRSGPRPAPVTPPPGARELASKRLSADAGRQFAVLTGDFNPIHWIGPAGRAAGFGGCILHGYATLAFAYEGYVRGRLAGRADLIRSFDARFSRPVRLPGTVRLFDGGDGRLHTAPSAGAPSSLIATVTLASETP